MVKKLGADIDTSITKRTNFVITGSAPGPSKMKKIEQFNSQGYDIRIIYEEEFLQMCKQ
jgi:DNA polymerase-3 subunit epsilon